MTTDVSTGTMDAEEADSPEPQSTSQLKGDDLLRRIKRWYKDDIGKATRWRKEAREAYKLRDGDQWSDEDKVKLAAEERPAIVFNRIGPTIDVVCGLETNQRQDISCKQRGLEDAHVAECGTALIEWARDQCEAEEAESDAFNDVLTGGMGWLEVRVDDMGETQVVEGNIDPFEMVWDSSAKARNLSDGRHVLRARELDLDAAREMFGADKERRALHATWATDTGEGGTTSDNRHDYDQTVPGGDDGGTKVTIVEAQWYEIKPIVLITYPQIGEDGQPVLAEQGKPVPGKVEELAPDKADMVVERSAMLGVIPISVRPTKKRCAYNVFVGGELLSDPDELPSRGDLAYQAITGKWDKAKGYPYGIVRAATDPQRWANKVRVQTLHILNTTAKNTILHEEGAFLDEEDAKLQIAKAGGVVKVQTGALTGGRITKWDNQPFQPGYSQFVQEADHAIGSVTGINPELLGMQDREQAGVLEETRKKAAVTILAAFFDNLRKCRKTIGALLVNYTSSGILPIEDLERAVGPELAPVLPQLMEPGALKFDIIVDESPASTNAKERGWAAIQQLMPMLLKMEEKKPLPTEVWAEIIRFMPLPSGPGEKIIKAISAPPSPETTQKQTEQEEIAKAGAVAKVERDKAAAAKDTATAQKTMVEAGTPPPEAPIELPGPADDAKAHKDHAQAGEAEARTTKIQIETARLVQTPIEDPNAQRVNPFNRMQP